MCFGIIDLNNACNTPKNSQNRMPSAFDEEVKLWVENIATVPIHQAQLAIFQLCAHRGEFLVIFDAILTSETPLLGELELDSWNLVDALLN